MADTPAAPGATIEAMSVDQAAQAFQGWDLDTETPPSPATPPEKPAPEATTTESVETPAESTESTEQPTETPEEPSEPVTLDPATKLKVKVDGQELEVTLDDALKGYSRTQDYTRKTQELSENRKKFEAEAQAVRAERQQYATQLKAVEDALTQLTPKEPDWAAVQLERPAEFATLYAQWQAHKAQVDAVRKEREAADAKVAQDRAADIRAALEAEKAKLMELEPEFREPEKARARLASLGDYAERTFGFTKQQLAEVTDHRIILVLDKARKWDEAQAKKPDVSKRIEAVKVATPGAQKAPPKAQTPKEKARQRLAQTGRIDDAAAAFFADLE